MKPESTDETRLKEMHERMIEAWNRGSAAGFAAPFAPDADFIAYEGTQLKGRTQFETTLQNTTMEGGVHFIRFLRPDFAVIHAWSTSSLPNERNASSSRDSLQLFIATKHGGYWQFDAMQNSRRLTVEQQRFADEFAELSPGDQGEVRHRVATMRH
jgi:uncharacterized protein (TIGR02246 family)